MIKSKLPNNVLGKIWKLSDVDRYCLIYKHHLKLCSKNKKIQPMLGTDENW